MRIIGGTLGGRRLRAPPGAATRPTADRVREAVFNILGPPPPDTGVLDAFAGSGAMGFEALSRGAARAWFVDSSRAAVRAVRDNAAALGVSNASHVHCGDVLALVRRLGAAPDLRAAPRGAMSTASSRFRWIFLDPPYRTDLTSRMLELLAGGALLEPDAVIVAEHDRRHSPASSYGCAPGGYLIRTDHRRYGDTEISIYRVEHAAERPADRASGTHPGQQDETRHE